MTTTRGREGASAPAGEFDVDRDGLFDAEIHITAGGPEREESSEESGEPGGRRRRGRLFYMQGLAFLFGASLLFFLIRAVGLEPIFQALGQIGYGFFILLGLAGMRHALRTLSMRTAVPRGQRRFTFWQAYTTRLAGETISFFTFTGPVLGEATKAALLRKRVPLASAVQALAVDNLLYNLSVALFISSGALVMLVTYDLPVGARVPLYAISGGMAFVFALVAWAVVSDVMPVTAAVDFFIRRGFKARWFSAKRENFRRVEGNVYDFYKKRPRAFFTMFACDFLAHATTVGEVAAVLWMLGFEPAVAVSYIIDSLTKVINLVFSFVPATIGVYEGGTGFILHTLGYAVATGLTIGIVRKASHDRVGARGLDDARPPHRAGRAQQGRRAPPATEGSYGQPCSRQHDAPPGAHLRQRARRRRRRPADSLHGRARPRRPARARPARVRSRRGDHAARGGHDRLRRLAAATDARLARRRGAEGARRPRRRARRAEHGHERHGLRHARHRRHPVRPLRAALGSARHRGARARVGRRGDS